MTPRPLSIDFNQYTHGDAGFKDELIGLMVADVLELQTSLQVSKDRSDISFYRSACHKINSTLQMLDDKEFNRSIEEHKTEINSEEKIKSFNRLCLEIMESLQASRLT